MSKKVDSPNILFCKGAIICLSCKIVIPDDHAFSEDDVIKHLQSKTHISSTKSLLKLFIPDLNENNTDSNLLDIVENLRFDVSWEVGNGSSSYICQRLDQLICLICQNVVSEVSFEIKRITSDLIVHIESALHLGNVKDKACGIYHPNEEVNYIAFHKNNLFCSFCQKFLKITENSVLQSAAEHLQQEEHKRFLVNGVHDDADDVINEIEDSVLIEPLGLLSETVDESTDNLIDEIEDSVLKEPLLLETVKDSTELNRVQSGNLYFFDKGHQQGIKHDLGVTMFNKTKGLETFTEKLAVFKLNEKYIQIKKGKFFCSVCEKSVDFDENKKLLKSHCYSSDHNEILTNVAIQYISRTKTNVDLSHKGKNKEKFGVVLDQVAADLKFSPHVQYFSDNGENFTCCLCNVIVSFTTCGRYVENHICDKVHLSKVFMVYCAEMLKQNNLYANNAIEKTDILMADSSTQTTKPIIKVVSSVSKEKFSKHTPTDTMNSNSYTTKDSPNLNSSFSLFETRRLKSSHDHKEKDMFFILDEDALNDQDDVEFVCLTCREPIAINNEEFKISLNCHFKEFHQYSNLTRNMINENLKCQFNLSAKGIGTEMWGPVTKKSADLVKSVKDSNTKREDNLSPLRSKRWIDPKHSTHQPLPSYSYSEVKSLLLPIIILNRQKLECIWRPTKIPKVMKLHSNFLIFDGPKVSCKLCEYELVSNNFSPTESSFSLSHHVKSSSHQLRYRNLLTSISNILENITEENQHILKWENNNFFCNICNKTIRKCENNTTLTLVTILQHCDTNKHTRRSTFNNKIQHSTHQPLPSYSYAEVKSLLLPINFLNRQKLKCIWGPTKIPKVMELHKKFLIFDGSKVSCKICEYELFSNNVSPTESIFFMMNHVKSSSHQLRYRHLLTSISNILENITEENQHILKWGNNNFFCIICNKTISKCENNTRLTLVTILQHCNTNIHTRLSTFNIQQQQHSTTTTFNPSAIAIL